MVSPTCFGTILSSSGSVPSAFWEMLNWGAVDRILWMGVLSSEVVHARTTLVSLYWYVIYAYLYMTYADPNLTSLTQDIQILLLQRWLTDSPGITLSTRRNTRGEMVNIYNSFREVRGRGRGRHDCISEAITKRDARWERPRGQRRDLMVQQDCQASKDKHGLQKK
jgi:hypothetical protein